ncbi:MAG: hypothetical protein MH213_01975 [Marinobacter sp.]|nr:hypothetical protein [Marinobacter sp.]
MSSGMAGAVSGLKRVIDQDINDVEPDKNHAGPNGRPEQIANRKPEHVALE